MLSPALSCRDLSCGFPRRTVLNSLSLEFSAGTVTGILGQNGSGKSTLLQTLAGLIPRLTGDIFIGSEPIVGMSVRERAKKLAFVPQQETTDFGFTALEIAGMGRIARSTGLFETEEDLQIARECLRQTDAGHVMDRLFRELSGGEQQRVLIARAMAQEAEIVLMDEPSSHLDLAHQALVRNLARGLAQRGCAVLVAVHDLNWAIASVDEAVILGEGQVVWAGRADEIASAAPLDLAFETSLRILKTSDGEIAVLPDYR